jgi:hypothetical protein
LGCPAPQGPPAPPPPRERSHVSIVREKPGDVRVDGVGPIRGFAQGRDCTFMHCLELVLEASGRKITYDELMGISGMAFRTQFRPEHWDVGNPDPLSGVSCVDYLFPAIGCNFEMRFVKHDDYAEADNLYRDVRKSIEDRMPVLAANIIPPEDWGIIVGCRGPRIWLCRSYNGGAEETDQPALGWPTAMVFLTLKKDRPPIHQVHVESLRRAVELFNRKSTGPAALGRQAIEAWIAALLSPKDRSYVHANFWTYVSLIDARGAAVRYLRMIAKEFGSKEIHLGMAADHYDSEVRLLLDGLQNVPSENAYPSSMPPAELRSKQSDTLRQALVLEEKAMESLRKSY